MICVLGAVYLVRIEGKEKYNTTGEGDGYNMCQFVLLFFHTVITICKADSAFDSQSSGTA